MIRGNYTIIALLTGLSLLAWIAAGCKSTVESDRKEKAPAGMTSTGKAAAERNSTKKAAARTVSTEKTSAGQEKADAGGSGSMIRPEEKKTGDKPKKKKRGIKIQGDADTSAWYEEVLSDNSLVLEYGGESYAIADYDYYALIDLAGDGNPELVLSTTEDAFLTVDDKAVMLAKNGEHIGIIGVYNFGGGCSLYCDKEQRKLGWFTRLSGQSNSFVYSLQDGQLQEEETLDFYEAYHDPNQSGLNEEEAAYVNGKKVSREKYQEEFARYFSDDAVLDYVPINR